MPVFISWVEVLNKFITFHYKDVNVTYIQDLLYDVIELKFSLNHRIINITFVNLKNFSRKELYANYSISKIWKFVPLHDCQNPKLEHLVVCCLLYYFGLPDGEILKKILLGHYSLGRFTYTEFNFLHLLFLPVQSHNTTRWWNKILMCGVQN